MFATKKVLIVDDEEKARLYLASIVEAFHPEFYVRLAATPNEALYIIEKDDIDILFLDVEMPGMSGLELLAELRKFSKNISVIFVSAYKKAEFIQKALRLEAVDYIDKPVDPHELEFAINKVLMTKTNLIAEKTHIEPSERFLLLTTVGEMFTEFDDIMCFETFKRYSKAYFTDGSVKIVRDNLESIAKKLPEKRFSRVSRQFIINIRYVKLVSKNNKSLILHTTKAQVEISRVFPHIIPELHNDFKL